MCPAWITSAEEPRTLLYELHKGRDVRGAVVEVELGTTKNQAGLEVAYSRNPLQRADELVLASSARHAFHGQDGVIEPIGRSLLDIVRLLLRI